MTKKIFIATLEIAIEATSEDEACDTISDVFNDIDLVKDWRYSPYNGEFLPPIFKGEFDLKVLPEGEIFKIHTKPT